MQPQSSSHESCSKVQKRPSRTDRDDKSYMLLFKVWISTNKNAFNASFAVDGARLPAPITPSILCDLPALVSHLLDSSYFTVGLTVFRQCQGASMGSPLSPALRSAVALFREYCFLRSFPTSSWRYATGLALRARYVDNVFFLGPTHMLHILTPSRPSLNPSFTADHWRWSMSQMRPFSVSFSLLLNALSPFDNHLTSHRSAAIVPPVLQTWHSLALICRLTRPRDLIFPQLIDLTQQYLDKDFTMTQLLPLLHQLCHRFHLPRPPLHAQCRFLTFSPDAAHGTDFRVKIFLVLTS